MVGPLSTRRIAHTPTMKWGSQPTTYPLAVSRVDTGKLVTLSFTMPTEMAHPSDPSRLVSMGITKSIFTCAM